jgi:hypothetical protein
MMGFHILHVNEKADENLRHNAQVGLRLAGDGKRVVPGRPIETATGWRAERLESFDDPFGVAGQFEIHRRQQPVAMFQKDDGVWEIAHGSIMPDNSTFGQAPKLEVLPPPPKKNLLESFRHRLGVKAVVAEPGAHTPEQQAVIAGALAALKMGADPNEIQKLLHAIGIEI